MDALPGEKIYLKIESDGTPRGTRVSTLRGEPIANVRAISFHMEADQLATVTIEVLDVPYLIEGEFQATGRNATEVLGE